MKTMKINTQSLYIDQEGVSLPLESQEERQPGRQHTSLSVLKNRKFRRLFNRHHRALV